VPSFDDFGWGGKEEVSCLKRRLRLVLHFRQREEGGGKKEGDDCNSVRPTWP